MKIYKLIGFLVFWLFVSNLKAQDNLENMLNAEVGEEINYTSATFKATRIMNGQSIEKMPQGQLDFRIHHRFGKINTGMYDYYGLDQASSFISAEYGITNWVMVGIGREFGSESKNVDGFVKFSLWRQCSGAKNMPVSISWFSSITQRTAEFPTNNKLYPFSTRLSYVNQALIARKFNNWVSFQLTPTHIHYNYIDIKYDPDAHKIDPNDLFALGAGGRVKLSQRISINAEYYYVLRTANMSTFYNPLSIGVDIETGGHVFQIIFTNASSMIEKDFIGRTSDSWGKAGIHLGFNISRVFDINHHK